MGKQLALFGWDTLIDTCIKDVKPWMYDMITANKGNLQKLEPTQIYALRLICDAIKQWRHKPHSNTKIQTEVNQTTAYYF